ncbi:MAG: hypothetical protein J6D57_05970 [Mogibacterium sp.]|nr:hypothetical protein [Mogibacterium sp.]
MHNKRVELKNKIKGIAKAALALSMSLLMPLTSIPVSAAESHEMLDPDRIGSISITFTYYDETAKTTKPVTGGNSVGLYKVADVIVDNGFKFVTDERFAGAGTIPDTDEALDAANLDLAEKMAAIAKSYDFDVQPKAMDAQGTVSFDGLEVGLYLVMQDAQGTGDNKLTIAPFLITVPQRNPDGSFSYDVIAKAKPIGVAKEKVTPPPTPRRLPQTGQMWWPVIALGGLGVIVFCFGMIRKNRQ